MSCLQVVSQIHAVWIKPAVIVIWFTCLIFIVEYVSTLAICACIPLAVSAATAVCADCGCSKSTNP